MLTDDVKLKLETGLPGAKVEIIDNSAQHLMHSQNRGGAHLKVVIIYNGFKDKSKVEQHQMVYSVLKEELKEQIHALALETKVE